MRRAEAATPSSAPVANTDGINRIAFGDFEIITISDGTRMSDGPHPIFGADQPVEAVAELMRQNYLPETKTLFQFTPTLVKAGNELILFDTGNGEAAREGGRGLLRPRLQAAGINPDDITTVVLTHMHGDHIGGLTEGGVAAFPNASYVTGEVEYDAWAKNDTERAQGFRDKVVPLAEKIRFLKDGQDVVTGVTAMAAFGHTPGHMIYIIESNGQKLALTADTANHFVASLQRPDWEVRFDMDKAMAAQARKTVFGMLASERMPFVGYHMPFPSVGYVEALDMGYRYIPETYQLEAQQG
jgi:glyoxylase-like metal-dependent hydrolase (beta-lactamase superfamily II)